MFNQQWKSYKQLQPYIEAVGNIKLTAKVAGVAIKKVFHISLLKNQLTNNIKLFHVFKLLNLKTIILSKSFYTYMDIFKKFNLRLINKL